MRTKIATIMPVKARKASAPFVIMPNSAIGATPSLGRPEPGRSGPAGQDLLAPLLRAVQERQVDQEPEDRGAQEPERVLRNVALVEVGEHRDLGPAQAVVAVRRD